MTSPWWEREPHVIDRRQRLLHTEPKMPSSGDVWKIVKHVVKLYVVFMRSLASACCQIVTAVL